MDVPVPQVDVQEITNTIEALQFQVRIQGKYSGKEAFLTKEHELKSAGGGMFQED